MRPWPMRLRYPSGGRPRDYTNHAQSGHPICLTVSSRGVGRQSRRYSVLELGADLGGKIGRRPLDALAEGKANKSGDPDRRARFLGGGFDDLAATALAVDPEGLSEEHALLV